jgi:uncharacterized protein (DUF2252 family)
MNSLTLPERLQAGKTLRQQVSRAAQGVWQPDNSRRDPIEVLETSNLGRLPELTPIRYGRMLRNPFAFLRGAPAVMASDLATTSTSGIAVQACGDCHLVNFGLFATPERNLIFDVNDFDETLRAPWEWDLKRLTTSFVVAGRLNGFSEKRCANLAAAAARSYREHLREFALMSPLDVFYFRVDAVDLINSEPDGKARDERAQMVEKARNRVGTHLFPKITEEVDGRHHFIENPPIITRVTDEPQLQMIRQGLVDYRDTLSEDRQFVFDRYRLEDFARRVVGVGSVGTRCYVALLVCDDQNPLLLQIKEARRSVMEPFAEKCPYATQGQRVVTGQRLMQAASDIFLGWLRGGDGHDYYVRQLRDMKFSIPVEDVRACSLERYAEVCGWTLARAHAKGGDAATISGYLGESDKFDQAITQFAVAYADQTEQDHKMLEQADRDGRIKVCKENL